jgi:hypothetical protein
MTREADTYRQLWQLFHQSTSVDGVIKNLKRLDDLIQSDEISLANAYELRSRAFRTLQELTVDDPKQGELLILEHLVPSCVEQPSEASDEVRIALSQYRDTLADWLNEYSELERVPMRDRVLDRLRQDLESTEPEGACSTVARIGFRRPDIVQALWKAVEANADDTGDVALFSLASLGVAADDRSRLISALHLRAAVRCNIALIGALRRLADPKSVDVVLNYWLQPEYLTPRTQLGSIALRILADVADVNDNDPDLQDGIWSSLAKLFTEYAEALSSELHLGSDLAPRCDSEGVVPFLFNWLGSESEQSERAAYWRWLLGLRLEDCVRPRQVEGWKKADKLEALSVLRKDAFQDTQHDGLHSSPEMQHKEMAWKMLLRTKPADLAAWYETGIETETNPYLRNKLSKLLANFRLDPLPASMLNLATEPFDAESSSGEWLPRLAAIEIAQSTASWEAFEALLSFGLTHQGRVLLTSTEALAEVALTLVRAGNTFVIDKLVETAATGREARHRLAASSALKSLASQGMLRRNHMQPLMAALFEEEREPLERSEIVAILGWLPADLLGPEVIEQLKSWAASRDDWLGGRSLEVLARRGRLLAEPELLTTRLGLQRVEQKWDWLPTAEAIGGAPFIIGLLYLQDPETLTPAIKSLLQEGDWQAVFPILSLMNDTYDKPGQPSLSTEIKEALMVRARSRQTKVYAETELFHTLARLAPEELAREPWETMWSNMLPDARAALADALGTANYEKERLQSQAIYHLLGLMGDGLYAVRRSAYRGLARMSSHMLEAACESWAEAPSVELRQRAAEAYAWLLGKGGLSDSVEKLHQQLVTNPERTVRQASDRAWSEGRERIWAEEYLSRVLHLDDTSNEGILAVWPHSQALMKIGDDECRRRILAELKAKQFPPHVKHWFFSIAKGIEEHWRKVTQKWPEPWLPWEGAVEEGEGKVVPPKGKAVQVQYSIWQHASPTPSEPPSWGGAAWPLDALRVNWEEFTLQLGDGRQGTAINQGVSSQVMTFAGTGPYPVEVKEPLESFHD